MAATTITKTVLTSNNFAQMPTTSAVHASDGAVIAFDAPGEKCLIIAENIHASAAKTVTLKAGDGFAATGDVSYEIASGGRAVVALETAKFKKHAGTNKGKILITGSDANIKIACVVLP